MKQETEKFLFALNTFLENFEFRIPTKPSHPVIFILGMSRSGTTVVYQTLVKYLQLGYPNNLIARFWRNPCIGTLLSRSIFGSDKSISFRSFFGNTPSITDPHEFGHFWKHWFGFRNDCTDVLSPEELNRTDWVGLSKLLQDMTRCFGMPVLFKQLALGFQAHLLSIKIPESHFIYVYRPSVDIASSLLKTRRERYGSEAIWFGLKPPKWQQLLNQSPLEQICRQVEICTRLIHEQVTKISPERLCTIDYDHFRKFPMEVVQKIKSAFGLAYDLSHEVLDTTPPPNADYRITDEEAAFFAKKLQNEPNQTFFDNHR